MGKTIIKFKSPWVPFISLLIASFFVIEAMAFQVTVVPVLTNDFGIAIALTGFISITYYLSHTVFGPIFGNFGDQVGRKKIVLAGFVIFGLSEFMAAISPNFTIYLIARFLQGVGAACVIPACIAYASSLFPVERRGLAFGIYMAISALGAAAGGLLGGILVGNFGWRSVYFFTTVATIFSFILVALVLPESEKKERKPFDFIGSVLLLFTVGFLLTFTMLLGNIGIASIYTISSLILGIIFLVGFIVFENKTEHPFMDLSFFKAPQFSMTIVIVLLTAIVSQAIIYTNAFFLTLMPGGGSSLTGFVTMCLYIGSTLGGLIGGKLSDMYRSKNIIITSILFLLVGVIMFYQFNAVSPTWYIASTVTIILFFVGLLNASAVKYAMSVVPKEKLGQGSGTYVMMRDLGNPIGQSTGLALFGVISATTLTTALTDKAQDAGVENSFMPAILKASETGGENIDSALATHLQKIGIKFMDLFESAQLDGMIMALNRMGMIMFFLCLICLTIAFVLPKKLSENANEDTIEDVGEEIS